MRQKGNLRLLMNANLWADMHVSKMEGGKVWRQLRRGWCGRGERCGAAGGAARCRVQGLGRSPTDDPHMRCLQFAAASPLQGVTFACINAAAATEEAAGGKECEGGGEGGDVAAPAPSPRLATFALRIKAPEILEAFVAAVEAHKAGGGKGKEEGGAAAAAEAAA